MTLQSYCVSDQNNLQSSMKYKTVEWLPDYKMDDVVFHPNIIEAKEWQSKGIDTRLFRKEGDQWIESGITKLELL
jgi:hypothetical protein